MASAPPFLGPDVLDEQDLYKCVHCGFCLQACPTYLETGLETESPRGRIALMKAASEGRIGPSPTVFKHWDLCIQCRACETACPSGVPYGKLIEAVTTEVVRHRKLGLLPRMAAKALLKGILPHQGRLGLLAGGLRLYQRLGLQQAVRGTGALRLLSRRLADLEDSAPSVSGAPFKARGQVIPAHGERRARVALLSGCVMPLVNGPEMRAVARVLSRNGCEIVVPREQVCCGAIHSHVGDMDTARGMARRNVEVFEAAGVDAVVTASAGCGARMKEYDELLRGDEEYGSRSAALAHKVKDVHELLAELPFIPPTGRLDLRVTYQDSCHLVNAQRVTEAPRQLLRSIPGLELVEMDGASRCCAYLKRRRLLRHHPTRLLPTPARLEDERRGKYGSPHSRDGKPRLPNPAPARRPPLRQAHPGTLHHRSPRRVLRRRDTGIGRMQLHLLNEASATQPAT